MLMRQIFFRLTPDKTLNFKGEKCVGSDLFKDCITVLLCANAGGTEKRKLLVIGKSKNPRCFKQAKSLPIRYSANKMAWMTSELFEAELRLWNWNVIYKKKRKILLLVDRSRGDKKSHMPLPQAHIIENDRMHQEEARSCHDTAGCSRMHCKSMETSNGQNYLQLFPPRGKHKESTSVRMKMPSWVKLPPLLLLIMTICLCRHGCEKLVVT
jgi:hypothetical protein